LADYFRKLSWGRWLARSALSIGMIAAVLWYTGDKSVTVSEFTAVVASTNVFLVLAAEFLDKFVDKSTYYKLYGGVYRAFGAQPGTRGGFLASILSPVIASAIIFMSVLYLVGGSLTMSLGSYRPAVLLWAAVIAIYLMLPETGDDEILFWIWAAAQVATKGQYLDTALFGLPGLGMLLAALLG